MIGVENDVLREGEKISFSEGGGGINIVFRPKYRPLNQGCLAISVVSLCPSWL